MPSKKLRNLLMLSIIVAIFVSVGYWNINPETFIQKPAAAVDDTAVDYYAINAHAVQFLPDGGVQYRMTGDRVDHMQASQITKVTNPDMHLYRGTVYPWHITSLKGEVNPDGTQVELIDDVRVARTDQKDRPTLITSTRMTVFPQQQYAQTDRDVRIDGGGGYSTGTGMKAYLKDSKIYLLSNARGLYEAR